MPEVYWYLSKGKLDLLKDSAPSLWKGLKAKLEFKLPFVAGSLEGATIPRLTADLKRVEAALLSNYTIKSYHELRDGEAPVWVRFEGRAARQVSKQAYLIAMDHGNTALILAGSAGYATGRSAKASETISPTADPAGAIVAAYDEDAPRDSLSRSLSAAWRMISRDAEAGGALPRVEGLAIFARAVAADKKVMRQADRSTVTRVVVASPLYVRQV